MSEYFCTIQWSYEDLREALASESIIPSKENVKIVEDYVSRDLLEQSIEFGNELIIDVIDYLKYSKQLKVKEGKDLKDIK